MFYYYLRKLESPWLGEKNGLKSYAHVDNPNMFLYRSVHVDSFSKHQGVWYSKLLVNIKTKKSVDNREMTKGNGGERVWKLIQ